LTFSTRKASLLQKRIKEKIREESLKQDPRIIGALDAAYTKDGYGIGVAVLYDKGSGRILETKVTMTKVYSPYIPGYLAFRELPPMMSAYNMLIHTPHVLLVDGHGRAHPRGAGIASHIGVILSLPTIGVAKKMLYGEIRECGDGVKCLFDRGEIIGKVLEKPVGAKKLFISTGNLITLDEAFEIVSELRRGRGLPIPLSIADRMSKRAAKNVIGKM
jgi:deoxyribonuclease V